MRNRLTVIGCVAALLLLAGLAFGRLQAPETPWNLADVSGHLPDLRFTLTDDKGQTATEQMARGKVTLLYFGFTECPGLCPIAMSRMASIFKRMGKEADDNLLLFVSVDPRHDTPQALRDFLKEFDPAHMTGLTGDEKTITDLTKRYRAAYRPSADPNKLMHSDTIYLFDSQGHARLIATDADSDDTISGDLLRLDHERR